MALFAGFRNGCSGYLVVLLLAGAGLGTPRGKREVLGAEVLTLARGLMPQISGRGMLGVPPASEASPG